MFTGIFACLFIINVATFCGLCMWIKLNETGQLPVEKLINHEKYSWMNTFYPAITLAATTVVVIYCIVDFRYTLQRAYFAFYMRQELEKGSSYLKMRTIEIECSLSSRQPSKDRSSSTPSASKTSSTGSASSSPTRTLSPAAQSSPTSASCSPSSPSESPCSPAASSSSRKSRPSAS